MNFEFYYGLCFHILYPIFKGGHLYLNIKTSEMETNAYKDVLIIPSHLFAKNIDKSDSNFRCAIHWFDIDEQIYIYPDDSMCCKGRSFAASYSNETFYRDELAELRKETLTRAEAVRMQVAQNWFKGKAKARRELAMQIGEHKHRLRYAIAQVDLTDKSSDIRNYQSRLAHTYFIDDDHITIKLQSRPMLPIEESQVEMFQNVFNNNATPRTIYYGRDYFRKRSIGKYKHAWGIASSYMVTGSEGVLVDLGGIDPVHSFQYAMSQQYMHDYHWHNFFNSFIADLPESDQFLKYFDINDKKHPTRGSKYWKGNETGNNTVMLTKMANHHWEKEFQRWKQTQQEAAPEEAANLDKFALEMKELNELELSNFKSMIAKRGDEWEKTMPPILATEHSMFERSLSRDCVNYDALKKHYRAVVSHILTIQQRDNFPTVEQRPELYDNKEDDTVTTTKKDQDITMPSPPPKEDIPMDSQQRSKSTPSGESKANDIDMDLSQHAQSASRQRIKRERKRRRQMTAES